MLLTILTMMLVIVSMIGFNALYVAGEFAGVSARKSRIAYFATKGNVLAKLLLVVLEDHRKLDNYIAASQVGITLSSIVLGIYGQQQIAPRLAPLLSPLAGEVAAGGIAATSILLLLTTLQVVLGELVPKSLAIQYPERVALFTTIPMRWSADYLLKPLILLLNGSGAAIMRVLGIHHSGGHRNVHSPEEIKFLLQQSREGGLLDEEEHQLLDSAFRFGKLHVGEIVIPRPKMVAVNISTPIDEILRIAAKSDHTRIPLYEGDIDHIIGFVHLKELFQLWYRDKTADVRTILRNISFVHDTVFLDDAWTMLNQEQSYLAIVFDEYGGTLGMITREDLLEELFGEVQDEFDTAEVLPVRKTHENTYLVRGDVAISHLNDTLGLSIEADDVYTIGGFLVTKLGHLPQKGDTITVENVRLKANVVADRAVEEIVLTIEISKGSKEDGQ